MVSDWLSFYSSAAYESYAPIETVAESSRKKVCRWGGKWGRRTEKVVQAVEEVDHASRQQDVELDAALWGELHRYIDIERVAAQLPLHAFYRARSVCKKWNSLPWNRPFLEQHSTTWLPKPYFVIHGREGCHQAILVKDVLLEKWILKPLPAFAFQHYKTSVAHGVVYTCTSEETYRRDGFKRYNREGFKSEGFVVRGTVFNMHTKVFRRLPHLNVRSCDDYLRFSAIAVDKHSGSYKVLIAGRKELQISVYDSVTGVWTQRGASPVNFDQAWEDSTHCEGVLYVKWRDSIPRRLRVFQRLVPPPSPPVLSEPKIFAYNFRSDLWTALPMTPPALQRAEKEWEILSVRGLGEWRGVLRDVTYDPSDDGLRVWEFEQGGQEWLEVDRMPADILDWFLDPRASLFDGAESRLIKTSYCEDYILMWSHGFPRTSGVARLVLYDMALKSWETLNVDKDWTCPGS